jgi:hypothetical protein
MKIEIGENLVYSYLKHIEGCRIVQTNWKTSGLWQITEYDKANAKRLFEKLKKEPDFQNLFKENSFEQLLKQAEIDVLGINSTEQTVYGIDIAFHSARLNYKDGVNKVIMKLVRTIFILQTYFKEYDRYISYFVTPIAGNKDEQRIKELIEKACQIISDDMITINFIANNEFFTSIVNPLIENTDKENDNAELFLRSLKLLSLDKTEHENRKTQSKVSVKATVDKEKRTESGMKIGQFVQFEMRKLFEQNKLTPDEIRNLQDKEYSKKVFNQNFEVLRSFEKEIVDNEGRNRYYAKERFFGNYYLTSQWVEYHWEPFLSWLSQFDN